MTNNKIMLQTQRNIIPTERIYDDNIDFFITSSKDLTEGTILYVTKSEVYLDFGTKLIIKVNKKKLIKTLIQIYYILNNSYLSINTKNKLSETLLKDWLRKKVKKGQKISLILETIDALKNIYKVNMTKTLSYMKYNKLFLELERIKAQDKTLKGYIINSIKGGFSVVIGGLIAFLPAKELRKTAKNKQISQFINSSMSFKISKINFAKKNVVLCKP